MTMSNSPLVVYTKLSPNYSSRNGNKIIKITPHHMAGDLSIETCGNVFAPSSRRASSNYGIGSDGRVGMYVPEDKRAWTSSNAANDRESVTIEIADITAGPEWRVSDAAWESLVALCVDICQRNSMPGLRWTGGKDGTLTCHDMFANTNCPGPYLKDRMYQLADEVNQRLGNGWTPQVPSAPVSTPAPSCEYNIWMQGEETNGHVMPAVHNNNDNVGNGTPIAYLSAWTDPGTLDVQAYAGGKWWSTLVNPNNINDHKFGAVGSGAPITGLRMYYHSPDGSKAVFYRVMTERGLHPWMMDDKDTAGSKDTFAGNLRSPILRVEAYIGDYKRL